jgi:hypothetical protein
MSPKHTIPRQRAALSAVTLVFLLSIHDAVGGGLLTQLLGLGSGVVLLLLLGRAAAAGQIGWPVGRS